MDSPYKGYDIESKDADGTIWFIEVKGRIASAETFTITRSEVGVGKNKPDQHILALVEVDAVAEPAIRYVRHDRRQDEAGAQHRGGGVRARLLREPDLDRGTQVPPRHPRGHALLDLHPGRACE